MKRYLLIIILLFIFFYGCSNYKLSVNNNFFVDDYNIFYTSKTGELCKYSLLDGSTEKITDDLLLKAYNDKYFIGYNKDTIKIFDRKAKNNYEIKNINTCSLDILNNDIFYVNKNDNNYIYKINLDSMENIKFLEEDTSKISVNKKYIFYEKNMNNIYRYSFSSNKSEKFFYGKYCFYFYCDDNNVYLSDYLNDYKVIQISISSLEQECVYDISTLDFYIYDNKLYYIPALKEDLYNDKYKYHIYQFDSTKGINKMLI